MELNENFLNLVRPQIETSWEEMKDASSSVHNLDRIGEAIANLIYYNKNPAVTDAIMRVYGDFGYGQVHRFLDETIRLKKNEQENDTGQDVGIWFVMANKAELTRANRFHEEVWMPLEATVFGKTVSIPEVVHQRFYDWEAAVNEYCTLKSLQISCFKGW